MLNQVQARQACSVCDALCSMAAETRSLQTVYQDMFDCRVRRALYHDAVFVSCRCHLATLCNCVNQATQATQAAGPGAAIRCTAAR